MVQAIKGAGTNASENKRIINMLFYHESWDIMIIKDHGTHLFPDNTLEILNKSAAQQLKIYVSGRSFSY